MNNSLYSLKAEIYYKIDKCDSSLAILNKSSHTNCEDALAKAANYVKLKSYDRAKSLIDSVNCYIEDYALANYYEIIGDKHKALKIYKEIKKHREWGHYRYYGLTLKRIVELESSNPKLLKELYYPTENPAKDIIEYNDNELRVKIFKLLDTLPECKGLERHIFRSPTTNGKDYYWIKVGKNIIVGHDYERDYKAQYDFFIYAKDLSVKYYNPETRTMLSLEEWRRKRK